MRPETKNQSPRRWKYTPLLLVLMAALPLKAQAPSPGCPTEVLENGAVTDCVFSEDSLTAKAENTHKLNPACPSPTAPEGGQCVLNADVSLDKTLEIASFTKLNCKGHRITPVAPGVLDNPATPGSEYLPSVPALAVLLNHAFGVKLQNCVIQGFDFGLLIVGNKITGTPGPGDLAELSNKILANAFENRYAGVLGVQTDNNEVKDNVLTVSGGTGIALLRDSDLNSIKNNAVVLTATVPMAGPILPEAPATANRPFSGIVIANRFPSPLVNIIANGALYQFPLVPQTPSGNLIEGNVIDNLGTMGAPGIDVVDSASALVVRQNTIQRAFTGVVVTGFSGNTQFPGTCSLDSARFCRNNADCNIPGIDGTSKGTCSGAGPQFIDARSSNVVLEDNTLTGPYTANGLMLANTLHPVVLRNRISGAAQFGALLGNNARETGIVSRNVVDGNSFGLVLNQAGGTSMSFGAQIFLNDFTGSLVRAIQVLPPTYSLASELSVSGLGNYWGRVCADSDGFRDSSEPDAGGRTDSPSVFVTDSHPFGVPVAAGPYPPAASTCK